jgi:hypothetical protein
MIRVTTEHPDDVLERLRHDREQQPLARVS